MQILLISGGNSNEREVSFRSGQNISEALTKLGHEVIEYDPQNGFEGLAEFKDKVDLAFPMLHGVQGEDGYVQAFLDEYGYAFVGSGVEASKLCFDKNLFKQKMVALGIRTPKWEIVTAETFADSQLTTKPYVLKPVGGGSSIDTHIIRDSSGSSAVNESIFQKYPSMLLEELITGIEITVPVLGESALPVIEIVPPADEEFDYENKYNGKTKELSPPQNVSAEIQTEAQKITEEIHKKLGVKHFSRTDFMISQEGELFVLELNTIPGMTKRSLMPLSAEAAGLDIESVVKQLLELAQSE